MIDKTQNQINVIHPYKTGFGYWVFDDEEVGLQKEPFVGSINEMLDRLTNDGTQCTVFISEDYIPGYNLKLIQCPAPDGTHEPGWYKWNERNLSGWLCPALLKYFDGYPHTIFVKLQN